MFGELLEVITPYHTPAEWAAKRRAAANAAARRAGGGFIEYNVRLSLTLRYLAGGAALDLCYLHGVAHTTLLKMVWETLRALDAGLPAFSLEDDIQDIERCRELAAGFASRTDNNIRGVIGALDGLSVHIEMPSDANQQTKFFPTRKFIYAMSAQAVCDSRSASCCCTSPGGARPARAAPRRRAALMLSDALEQSAVARRSERTVTRRASASPPTTRTAAAPPS